MCGQLELLKQGLVTEAQELIENVDFSSAEEDEEEEDKKKTKTKTKKTKRAGRDADVAKQVEEAVKRLKERGGAVCSQEDQAPTRSVESLRQAYVNEFLKKNQSKANCVECKTKGWKSIMLHDSRIVYSVYSGGVTVPVGDDQDSQEEGETTTGKKKAKTPAKKKRKSGVDTPMLELNASEAR